MQSFFTPLKNLTTAFFRSCLERTWGRTGSFWIPVLPRPQVEADSTCPFAVWKLPSICKASSNKDSLTILLFGHPKLGWPFDQEIGTSFRDFSDCPEYRVESHGRGRGGNPLWESRILVF